MQRFKRFLNSSYTGKASYNKNQDEVILRKWSVVQLISGAENDNDNIAENCTGRRTTQHSNTVRTFGKKGKAKGQFNSPSGVAVTSSGDIIIADSDNRRLQLFSNDGRLLKVMGHQGQLLHPVGLALSRDSSEDIYVTDDAAAWIKVFSQTDDEVRVFAEKGALEMPYGIAISADHHVLVTDLCKHCLLVFSAAGNLLRQFGHFGSEPCQFDQPYYITTDSKNRLLVSDFGNMCIKKFTLTGELIRSFIATEFKLGDECVLLAGITCDNEDNVILVGNSMIYVMAGNGRLWELLMPGADVHSPKAVASHQSSQLIFTQYGFHHLHQVSTVTYCSENFAALKNIS